MKEITTRSQVNLDDSLMSPKNSPHFYDLATKMATSSLVPKCYQGKPQDLFLAMALGYKLGFSVEQAAQNIVVINSKPCMYGDALLGLVMSHPSFEDIVETPIEEKGAVIGYECVIKRAKRSPVKRTFTLEQAVKAGLVKRSQVWQQYPERMLQMRARGYAIRDAFPDALNGLMPAEEVQDYIDVDYTRVAPKSRTEALKEEMLQKDTIDENISTNKADMAREEADKTDRAQGQDENHASMDKNQPQEDGCVDAVNPADQEVKQILIESVAGLMDDLNFGEESYHKALDFYEVENIQAMTIEQLEHFEAQLKRKRA